MLTELHLSNFKSWRELDMKLGRVTGLFGTNSSGKSSILQFLLMLKQTKDATDRGLVLDLGGQHQLVNLGTFKDLIYKHQESLHLKWKIIWKVDKSLKNSNRFNYAFLLLKNSSSFDIEINTEVLFKDKEIKVQSLSYAFDAYYVEIKLKDEGTDEYEFNAIELSHKRNKTKHKYTFKNRDIHIFPIKTYLFNDNIKSEYNKLTFYLPSLEIEYEIIMDQIYYLAPLREYPKREYQWSGASPSHVGYRGENTINAILAATIRNETRIIPHSNEEKTFQEVIAYWLKELGLIHEFSVKEIAEGRGLYDVVVKKDKDGAEAFLTDVGFGVSQVLPALVLLYYVPEGSIILMEQPEIHLHPSVQSGLADVILQVSKQRNLQVIVESHSEHLLQRFQRRVAEESYPVDDLKLYFCDIQQGESKLIDLKINEYGEIENYPDNFFGDEMAEIAATRRASLKHKIRKEQQDG